jgi:hypothetical protein
MKENIPIGAYSIPVKINSDNNNSNKEGYETPSFINKKERKIKNKNENENNDISIFLKASIEKDINVFTAQLDNKKDKHERILACI